MLGATLDLLDEGVAVLDTNAFVVYWNETAAALTGHMRMNVLSRRCPVDLYKVVEDHRCADGPCDCTGSAATQKAAAAKEYTGPRYSGQMYMQKSISLDPANAAEQEEARRGVPVEIKHHLGHTLPA